MVRIGIVSIFMLLLVYMCGCNSSWDSIASAPALVNAAGDVHAEKGQGFIEQRKFAEAIPQLEKALTQSLRRYNKSDILTMIGNCYNEMEDYARSLEYHDLAISEDPSNFRAYVNKGIVYRLTGDFDKAAEYYAQALKLAPDYAELHASMGALAIFQGQYETAVKHLERAVALDDSVPVAHSNLAFAYATVGRFTEADEQLKKAIVRGYHQPEVIRQRIDQLRVEAKPE